MLHFAEDNVTNDIMTKRDFDVHIDRYHYWNQQFLYTLGLWPLQSRKEQVFRICMVTIFQAPLITQQICRLLTLSFKLDSFCNVAQLLLPAICFTCCYYSIAFNFLKVKLLYSRLKFDVEHALDEGEFTIVKRYAIQTKWCTRLFIFFLYFYCIVLTSPSVLNVILYSIGLVDDSQLTLPIPIGYILNSTAIHYAMLFYETIVIYIISTTALGIYSAFILLIQHACSQFTIINMKIHLPFTKNNRNIRYARYYNGTWDEYGWIVDIIKRYTKTTELVYVQLLNSLSENLYLAEIFLGLFLIMLTFINLFRFSSIMQNKREALLYCIYILGTMLIVYLNLHFGQRLLDHSSKVFLKLGDVPIYKISTKTQKLLLFLMMRSMKPCALSIGGMFVASHEFYANLMQKAASYAMACYTMR